MAAKQISAPENAKRPPNIMVLLQPYLSARYPKTVPESILPMQANALKNPANIPALLYAVYADGISTVKN